MSSLHPEHSEATGTEPDTESDPSLDDGKSADWTDEGGATTSGPATDPTADDE
jgi:hypothetical protein